jgi:integrase/recombinase XerD
LGPEPIRSDEVYLTKKKKLATGSILMAISALRFLYKVTLKKDRTFEDIIPAPQKASDPAGGPLSRGSPNPSSS